jgi:hypothetical protein
MKVRTIDRTDPATGITYTATFTFEDYTTDIYGDSGTTMYLESVTIDDLEVDPDMVPPCVQQYFDGLVKSDFDLTRQTYHEYD